jgi:hypothetical protein
MVEERRMERGEIPDLVDALTKRVKEYGPGVTHTDAWHFWTADIARQALTETRMLFHFGRLAGVITDHDHVRISRSGTMIYVSWWVRP